MYQIALRIKCASFITILLMLSVASPVFAAAQQDEAPVRLFTDGSEVVDASSKLVRTGAGVSMTLQTSGLTPGSTVTVWWVIFNNPEYCSGGMNPFGLKCDAGDFSNPDVEASVMIAAGHVIGGSGMGNFGGSIKVGKDTKFVALPGGLTNPEGADIHLVVRDHGPLDPTLMPGLIHTVNVCNPMCTDVQFSAHETI
jgi:hypothetical protein